MIEITCVFDTNEDGVVTFSLPTCSAQTDLFDMIEDGYNYMYAHGYNNAKMVSIRAVEI